MPPFVRARRRYIKGEFVGGCDIMTTMFKEGDLQKLLKEKNVAMEE
jgi:monothiol glutaredoxin